MTNVTFIKKESIVHCDEWNCGGIKPVWLNLND